MILNTSESDDLQPLIALFSQHIACGYKSVVRCMPPHYVTCAHCQNEVLNQHVPFLGACFISHVPRPRRPGDKANA